jgi:hypothetical protein
VTAPNINVKPKTIKIAIYSGHTTGNRFFAPILKQAKPTKTAAIRKIDCSKTLSGEMLTSITNPKSDKNTAGKKISFMPD